MIVKTFLRCVRIKNILMCFHFIGEIEEIIFEAILLKKPGASEFSKDTEFINGLQSHEVLLQRHIPLHKAKVRDIVTWQSFKTSPVK